MLGLLGLPFRLIRLPLSLALVVVGVKHRRRFHLPVAGLDESRAQSILFALRRAATKSEEEAVAAEWLAALQVVQVASGRLLHELDGVEAHLQFWNSRLRTGRHFWFTLLQRGPVAFVRRLGEMVRWRRRRRRRGPRAEARDDGITDAELVEKRVLIFRLLHVALCEALAGVQRAGSLLHLRAPPPLEGPAAVAAGDASVGAADVAEVDSLFRAAEDAVLGSLEAVEETYARLRRNVRATLTSQQAPAGTAAEDQPMLRQALVRVLGVSRIRRIFTQPGPLVGAPTAGGPAPQQQLLPEVGGGAAAAAAELQPRAAAFQAAQRAVGFTAVVPLEPTVHTVLAAARQASSAVPRDAQVVALPEWLRMPTQAQRYWLQYTLVGVAVGYGTLFIVRHSPLVGSRDLEDWGLAAAAAVRAAWAEHVVGPLERVRGELFNTFRRRPAIVSMGEYEADRDSLHRMLDDFSSDYVRRRGEGAARAEPRSPAGGGGDLAGEAELLHGMELMMRSYEQELKKPIRNLLGGDLARSLLIQVQKLKVDTESAMLEIDQILRANELSISLVAAVPAFLVAGAALYGVGRVLTPAPPDPRREAVPARVAMIEVERALEAVAAAAAAGRAAEEAEGLLAYRVAVAFSEAEQLFRRHRGIFRTVGTAEWPNLRGDLLELAGPSAPEQKLRTAARMMRVYAVYQQF